MWNAEVKCIKGYGEVITKGKIYEVVNGRLKADKGGNLYGTFKNIDELNDRCVSKFELRPKELTFNELEVNKIYNLNEMDYKITGDKILWSSWKGENSWDKSAIPYNDLIDIRFTESPKTINISLDGKSTEISYESALSLQKLLNDVL